MSESDLITTYGSPPLHKATMVLSFTGWMDGGNVSTGTVQNLVHALRATRLAEIDSDPFYVYDVPGTMDVAELFRPPVAIEEGLVTSLDMPSNTFYAYLPANLILFVGKEPHLRWHMFSRCILQLARQWYVKRIIFVGSFGGPVPHTRLPRLYVSCSNAGLLPEMEEYGVRRSGYQGPCSFATYLMTQVAGSGIDMISMVAEVPGYLQGSNPASIEAVTRRLAKLLGLHLDLSPLQHACTVWELRVSQVVEQSEELAETVHKLEEAYDNELLEASSD